MDAVAYYRTSSKSNVGSDKDSKIRQEKACRDFAGLNGFDIVKDFYDGGISGTTPLLKREGFRSLLQYCEKNGIKTILVESSSRFARDLIVAETGFQYLTGLGFSLIAVDSPNSFLENNPSSVMIRRILHTVAQYQKDELVLKLQVARERKRAMTGKCGGRKSVVEKHPEILRIVKRLKRKNPKTGLRRTKGEIARKLFSMGYRTGKGNPFSQSQVERILLR